MCAWVRERERCCLACYRLSVLCCIHFGVLWEAYWSTIHHIALLPCPNMFLLFAWKECWYEIWDTIGSWQLLFCIICKSDSEKVSASPVTNLTTRLWFGDSLVWSDRLSDSLQSYRLKHPVRRGRAEKVDFFFFCDKEKQTEWRPKWSKAVRKYYKVWLAREW